MLKVPALALAVGMTLLGIMACQKQVVKDPGASAGATSPKSFTLTLASGGGFSGLTQGFTLASGGEVKAWQRHPGAPEATLWTKQVQADSVVAFAKALEEFLPVDLKETGNMTASIRYALPDTTYRWSISGAGASPQGPEPFRTWYARAEAYCRGLAPAP